jgi:HEPN domain-containing protein
MDDSYFAEAAQAWFARGNNDRRSASALFSLDPPEVETTAFHCQQAAEKYLKGVLAYYGINPPRTHDLIVLLDLVLQHKPILEKQRDAARFLTPFAVQGRYPFTGITLTAADAALALVQMNEICDAVRNAMAPT